MVCVRPFIVSWLLGCLIIATQACFAEDSSTSPPGSDLFPVGWQAAAPRDEIRPRFSYLPDGGPQQSGAFVIETKNTVAEHGWVQKLFPVRAKEYVRFQAFRRLKNVATPHRSAVVRIVWQNAQGQPVLADPPDEKPSKSLPLAEPEHPLDGITNDQGWTTVAGTYRVPSHATHALIELHLQWAPQARCEWSDVTFQETSATAPRKVRLGTIHYVPSGKSAMANCEEYAPLIEKADQHKIDLIVLGETVPYVRLAKSPVETAESIPGPTTEYFSGLAKSHHLHIVVGLYERDRQTVYNTAVLIGPNGELVGKYRKVCLPHKEIEAGITPGNDYPVFETSLGKIGLMVCYDGFFPEVARELTNRGAEVIAWPVWGCNPLLAQARACENHVYVVSSTFTDSKSNWMISAIYDHAGTPIARAEKWGDVIFADVDLSQRHFWYNNLGDFHSMVQRHRPPALDPTLETR